MTPYQILYWHDIPVQIRAGARRERVSVLLPPRFQEAVDQAAMAAGLVGSDVYSALFVWGPTTEAEGSPDEVVRRVAAELDRATATIDWRATAAALRETTGGG